MKTDKPRMTLSEAIAGRRWQNWLEGEAKRAVEREAEQAANDQRNQFIEKVSKAFMSWFFAETGIEDMENAKIHVSLDLPKF